MAYPLHQRALLMRHTPSLCAVFTALLGACTAQPSSDDTTLPSTSGSCATEGDSDLEVAWSELQGSIDPDGTIVAADCPSLCGSVFGDVYDCSLVDPLPSESGDATSSTGSDGPGSTSEDTGNTDDTGLGESTGDTGTGEGTGGTTDDGGGTVGAETSGGEVMGTTDGELTVTINCEYIEQCLGGRGHEALRSRPDTTGDDRMGRWLAAMAHSEAASVVAFRSLADELSAHGAPNELVQRARSAAMDEVDHAEVMTRLAEQRGVTPNEPRFDAIEVRDLATIATENAVEGCVRETWSALEAAHQARAATDPQLRRVMAGIAVDETRHAQFSHDLDRWLSNRLDDEAKAAVEAARRRAADELLEGMQGTRDPLLRSRAGLPSAAVAQRLCEGLRQRLWA